MLRVSGRMKPIYSKLAVRDRIKESQLGHQIQPSNSSIFEEDQQKVYNYQVPVEKVYVFDTNVLLNDPHAIFAYEHAEVVIPQTVLSELDKLKTGRTDREIRYRGREFSRILFELSEYGSLTEGIPLDNESIIRVVPFDPNSEMPPPLNGKNADDRILGCAWQIAKDEPESQVTLVTNDLNMLLKAQTLGINVKQHEYRSSGGRLRSFIGHLGRRRVGLLWLAVPIMLVGLFVVFWLFRIPSPIPTGETVPTLTDPLQTFSTQELALIKQLKSDPNNERGWMQLAKTQLDWANRYQEANRLSEARIKYQDAANSFRYVLNINPRNVKALNNLGTISFILGDTQQAISQYLQAINIDPDFADVRFNLAFVLWRHQDYKNALREFEAYLRIAPNGQQADEARQAVKQIRTYLKSRSAS